MNANTRRPTRAVEGRNASLAYNAGAEYRPPLDPDPLHVDAGDAMYRAGQEDGYESGIRDSLPSRAVPRRRRPGGGRRGHRRRSDGLRSRGDAVVRARIRAAALRLRELASDHWPLLAAAAALVIVGWSLPPGDRFGYVICLAVVSSPWALLVLGPPRGDER